MLQNEGTCNEEAKEERKKKYFLYKIHYGKVGMITH